MMILNKEWGLPWLLLLGLLCSCGDETSKVVDSRSMGYESYDSVDDLPDCTDENEGELAWVSDEGQMRICADEKWFAMMPKNPETTISCSTKMSEDRSGYTVMCNGDSIGFVRDEVLLETDKDKDCSVVLVKGDTLEIACDSIVSVLIRDVAGNLVPEETELDSEQIALNLENVGGFSQKGPFVTGSEVTVYELQNGRTLKQTGKSFQGSISDDKGAFNVRTVKVASQYAYLVAKGVYLSEIDGKKSNTQIQLSAITDLRNRNSVNVNILTHLEYERVLYLVTKKKMTVASAKQQAQKEIFDLFHVESEKFKGNPEDWSIAGSGDEDAALLAISILLQKDDKTSDLSKRINTMSSSIADSGSCDDSLLLDLADWVAIADSLGRFSEYRENVKQMGLSAKVAEFEKYLRNFWNEEYGLEDCDSVGRIISATRGKLKNSSSRFICEDNYGVHSWRLATEEEKELYAKKPAADGTLDTGVSGNVYVYDSVWAETSGFGWRLADKVESEYGLCKVDDDSVVVSIDDYMEGNCYDSQTGKQYYWCDGVNRKWTTPQDCYMVDTYGWKAGTDGETKYADIRWMTYAGLVKHCFIYDSIDGAWRNVKVNVCSIHRGECTHARAGKYFRDKYSGIYKCKEDLTWDEFPVDYEDFSTYWILDNVISYGECLPLVPGTVESSYSFVCDKGEWRLASNLEKELGEPCFRQDTLSYSADSAYVCYAGAYANEFCRKEGPAWIKRSDLDLPKSQRDYLNDAFAYDSIVDSRDGRTYKTIKIGADTWTAENMLYFDKWVMNDEASCYGDSTSGCEMWRIYYWTVAMNISGVYLSSSAKEIISEKQRGVCPEGWHVPTVSESEALLVAAGSYDALLSAKRKMLNSEDYNLAISQSYDYSKLSFVNASNSSGFSAVCGFVKVLMYNEDIFSGFHNYEIPEPKTCWWTSEEYSDTQAKAFCVSVDVDAPLIEIRSKEDALPVRCVQDKKEDE